MYNPADLRFVNHDGVHGRRDESDGGFASMASLSRDRRTWTATGLAALVLIALLGLSTFSPSLKAQAAGNAPKVCFSPEGHCASIILDEIAAARQSIRVQAYSFTAHDISDALIAAAKRGVDVAVIVDKSQTSERYSVLSDLNDAHLAVYIDYCCAIAHNKVIIIDEHRLLTGSYNFTKAAESKNAENLLVLEDPVLAKAYLENWTTHRMGAEKWAMR